MLQKQNSSIGCQKGVLTTIEQKNILIATEAKEERQVAFTDIQIEHNIFRGFPGTRSDFKNHTHLHL